VGPTLSIVLPVYNEEPGLVELHRRLTQVMAGTGEPYEVIFVNDGSTDGSLSILSDLAAADQHVRILNFSRNFGHLEKSSAHIGIKMKQHKTLLKNQQLTFLN
jgi:dolichol-phosphate mannosyltransferase